MTDSFEKIHVKDDRLSCTSKIKYGVLSGAQSVTAQQFKAISASTSACVFNVAVPSNDTIKGDYVWCHHDYSNYNDQQASRGNAS